MKTDMENTVDDLINVGFKKDVNIDIFTLELKLSTISYSPITNTYYFEIGGGMTTIEISGMEDIHTLIRIFS